MQQKVLEPVLKLIAALGGGQQATNGHWRSECLLVRSSQQPAIDPRLTRSATATQFSPQIIDPDDSLSTDHQQPQAASNQPPPPRRSRSAGAVSPIDTSPSLRI